MLIDKYLSITDKTPRGTDLRGAGRGGTGQRERGAGRTEKSRVNPGRPRRNSRGAAIGYRILQRAQQRTTEAKEEKREMRRAAVNFLRLVREKYTAPM